jgi:hypothetical protein
VGALGLAESKELAAQKTKILRDFHGFSRIVGYGRAEITGFSDLAELSTERAIALIHEKTN